MSLGAACMRARLGRGNFFVFRLQQTWISLVEEDSFGSLGGVGHVSAQLKGHLHVQLREEFVVFDQLVDCLHLKTGALFVSASDARRLCRKVGAVNERRVEGLASLFLVGISNN